MKEEKGQLTDKEREVVMLVGRVWDLFSTLPPQHSMEKDEFCRAVHVCQQIVLCRPVVRTEGWCMSDGRFIFDKEMENE
jgi:hypothetical protein